MKKIVRLGKTRIDNKLVSVFCKIEITDGKLSISGVEGPVSTGDCAGSCGQIDMHRPAIAEYAPGWDRDKLAVFWDTWHNWHLNDMRAGCQHQRGWDTQKKLELQPLTRGEKYHELRRLAERGEMTEEQFRQWPEMIKSVDRLTTSFISPKHPDCWGKEGRAALALGLVKIDQKAEKSKTAGWVHPEEHPEGLLCKPCPVCGYKYGSEWLREELPAGVVSFLQSLPDADIQPAWV